MHRHLIGIIISVSHRYLTGIPQASHVLAYHTYLIGAIGRRTMNEGAFERLIPRTYALQGWQNIRNRENALNNLLTHQKLPDTGMDDQTIEFILHQLSLMDSNNFHDKAGVGEREGRVFSNLVARRHFGLAHGIGRSGDIAEVQPKAAGSSVLYKVTNKLAAHALHLAGVQTPLHCIIFPLATGMTIATTLLAMKSTNPSKTKVIWSRIDQKSCLKAISMVGLTVLMVEQVLKDGVLTTDVNAIQDLLSSSEHKDDILAVISTTSCFAPRQPDKIDEIAQLCTQYNVFHLVNNAYGVQCKKICKLLDRAFLKGRVDAVIQSTDKNFLVPVGGAILASNNKEFLSQVAGNYPGRASVAPVLDLFITLLSMGKNGYQQLLQQREDLLPVFQEKLNQFCEEERLTLIVSPNNRISFAVSLQTLLAEHETASNDTNNSNININNSNQHNQSKDLSFLGSMLFQRNVSGCRVVLTGTHKTTRIAGVAFHNWGAHSDAYPDSYFTVACAMGMSIEEIQVFFSKVKKTLTKFRKLNAMVASH